MDFDELISLDPKFHTSGDGELVSYRSCRECCLYLYHHTSPTMRTVETGCGLSTVCFAIKGSEHYCVESDDRVIRSVNEFCAVHGISLERCTFLRGRSEDVFPRMPSLTVGPNWEECVGVVDFALIDGRHAFPTPFIDWYHISDQMRLGSILVVDDVQLWPCGALADFLEGDDSWDSGLELGTGRVKAKVFAKTDNRRDRDKWWGEQPYVFPRSVTGG